METKQSTKIRTVTGTAMLTAVAVGLQYIEISIPIMPSFIKLDFSDLPELIGAFAYGPLAGVLIALLKNLIHMALISVPFNYFVIYPLYYNVLGFPQAAVLQMYQIILPKTKSILQALLIFNLPFTFVKGLIVSIITMIIYKPLSQILKGKK